MFYCRLMLFIVFMGISCSKQCQVKKNLLFIIDSTNHTTSRDFGVQLEIIRYLLNEFQPDTLTVSVYVYDGTNVTNIKEESTVQNGFFYLTNTEKIEHRLSFLQFRTTGLPFSLSYLEQLVSNFSTDNEQYSIIFAGYESAKELIHPSQRITFTDDARYFIAFLYNSSNFRGDVFAQRDSNVNSIYLKIMNFVCPSKVVDATNASATRTSDSRKQATSVDMVFVSSLHSVSYLTDYEHTTMVQAIVSFTSAPTPRKQKSTLVFDASLLRSTSMSRTVSSQSLNDITSTMSTDYPMHVTNSHYTSTMSTDCPMNVTRSHYTITQNSITYGIKSRKTKVISLYTDINATILYNFSRSKSLLNSFTTLSSLRSPVFTTISAYKMEKVPSSIIRNHVYSKGIFFHNVSTSVVSSQIMTNFSIENRSSAMESSMEHPTRLRPSEISIGSVYFSTRDRIKVLTGVLSTASVISSSWYGYMMSFSTSVFTPSSPLEPSSSRELTSSRGSSSIKKPNLLSTTATTNFSISNIFAFSKNGIFTIQPTRQIKTINVTLSKTDFSHFTSLNQLNYSIFSVRLKATHSFSSSIDVLSATPSMTQLLTEILLSSTTMVIPSFSISPFYNESTKMKSGTVLHTSSPIYEQVTPSKSQEEMSSVYYSVNSIPSVSSSLTIGSATVIPFKPLQSLRLEISSFLQQKITIEDVKNETWVKHFINRSSILLRDISEVDGDTMIEDSSLNFVAFIENVLFKVGEHLAINQTFIEKKTYLAVKISAIDTGFFNGYSFSDHENSVEKLELPKSLFENTINNFAVIVGMSYRTLPRMKKNIRKHFKVFEKVFTVSVNSLIKEKLEDSLKYKISVNENNLSNYDCVFWNGSNWSNYGCIVANWTSTLVTCECSHMTSFSVLMQVTDFKISVKHRFILSLISYIGCAVSIAACVLLILTYMMCGRLVKVDRNIIHMNLALAIAVANSFFLCADSVHKYEHVCLGVSIGLYYSYLAAFFWMLVEGIHVYLMIVKVFRSPRKMHVYMIIGWVLPAIISFVTAFKFHDSFTRDDFCWLSLESKVIWLFVGPVLFVILINTVILAATLNASHKMCVDETEFSKLQRNARLTLLLMPIFGTTWVFGVMAINKQLLFFQYIFTGLNSLQGLFIFLCYCVINNEVKREYQRVRRQSQYSSTKTNGYSENGFSTYIHPYPRNRIKSALSVEEHLPTVQLTRYDIYENDKLPHTRQESISDTLTKRHKKQYSIELMQLTQAPSQDDGESVFSLIPNEEFHLLNTSAFDCVSRANSVSSNGRENESTPYKTFHNTENGVVLSAYRV